MSTKILLITLALLVSCVNNPTKPTEISKKKPTLKTSKSKFLDHFDFTSQEKYPKTYDIYENKILMAIANPNNTTIEVNTKTQRVLLLVNGEVAYDSPATTGSETKKDINDGKIVNKATPKGTYKIVQKLAIKKSNIYGNFFYNGRKVYTGDIRKYKEPYDEFVGADMTYWMRFNDAIGLHYSDAVIRYPGSNGCVRLPMKSVKNIFSVVKVGTQVDVVGGNFETIP